MSNRHDEGTLVGDADHFQADFRRSSFCGDLNCVEVATGPDGSILLRDTKDDRNGSILCFTEQEWNDFLRGVAAGEFSPAALAQHS
jgi:hypothetical protein